MQTKIMFSLVACLLSLMLVASSTEAFAMSGTVNFAGNGLNGAKVTIEKVGTFRTVTSGASGTWSDSSPTGTYTVSAMKDGFTHVTQSGISQSQTGLIHNLSSRSDVTAEFKIVGDEEFRTTYGASWQTTAKNKLFYAEPYFRADHSIAFADVAYYTTWDSNDSPVDCNGMVTEAMSETGWSGGTYSGAQILAVFTAQNIPSGGGGGTTNGCVNIIPSSGGTHPAFIIRNTTVQDDTSRWVMHEITHLYGFSHTQTTCGTEVPAIMNTDTSNFSCSDQTQNWRPVDDSTIESSRRTWY